MKTLLMKINMHFKKYVKYEINTYCSLLTTQNNSCFKTLMTQRKSNRNFL